MFKCLLWFSLERDISFNVKQTYYKSFKEEYLVVKQIVINSWLYKGLKIKNNNNNCSTHEFNLFNSVNYKPFAYGKIISVNSDNVRKI